MSSSGRTFRVRDWLAHRKQKARPPPPADTDLIATNAALGDVDRSLRRTHRALFQRVDRLLARPGRKGQEIGPFVSTRETAECLWCGDTFPVINPAALNKYCSRACRFEHQRFNKRHKPPTKGSLMAMDQREQYRQDAESHRRGADIMAYFAEVSRNSGDTAAVTQIGHYKEHELEMAALFDTLATSEPEDEDDED